MVVIPAVAVLSMNFLLSLCPFMAATPTGQPQLLVLVTQPLPLVSPDPESQWLPALANL